MMGWVMNDFVAFKVAGSPTEAFGDDGRNYGRWIPAQRDIGMSGLRN